MASLDELRVFGIVAKHAAQFLNAGREGIVGHRDVRPHGGKQLGLRHGGTRVRYEDLEHLRGFGRQAHFFAAQPKLARVELEAVFAEPDALRHGRNGLSIFRGASPPRPPYALTSCLTSRAIDRASTRASAPTPSMVLDLRARWNGNPSA